MNVSELSELDERLKKQGMISVSELLKGSPLDVFHKNAGVVDLRTFEEWLKVRLEESLSLKANLILDDKEDDELFEWSIAHSAVFNEVLINFKAAMINHLKGK